jgi:light-regulated signal transduction histidine kinase (bacteriophytochrome)
LVLICRKTGATVAGSSVDTDPDFPRYVSLACHDLRTPLATVAGFAGTLARDADLGQPAARYVGMIEAASAQLADLLDQVALVSRIEAGRYEPELEATDTLELVRAAAARLGDDRARAGGRGGRASVDVEPTERALAGLALAALRHGSLELVELEAAGPEVRIAPVTQQAAPIVLAEELRDLGAATAVRVLAALGGSVILEGETLRVALPSK